MSIETQKLDPIRNRYFNAVEMADKFSDWLFYVGVILSLATLFIDKNSHPNLYNYSLILFATAVILLFMIGQLNRSYLTPRAEDKRRKDFFSSACGISLTHEVTIGYYNNNFKEPIKRMAAQLLENSLFSKEIVLKMAFVERLKVATYIVLWLGILLYRDTDLGLIVVAAQTLLSEQILSRYFKLEALRMRFEKTYECTYTLLQSGANDKTFFTQTLDLLVMYESAKAAGGITLSSKIFDSLNDDLSKEWNRIKTTLHIPDKNDDPVHS